MTKLSIADTIALQEYEMIIWDAVYKFNFELDKYHEEFQAYQRECYVPDIYISETDQANRDPNRTWRLVYPHRAAYAIEQAVVDYANTYTHLRGVKYSTGRARASQIKQNAIREHSLSIGL